MMSNDITLMAHLMRRAGFGALNADAPDFGVRAAKVLQLIVFHPGVPVSLNYQPRLSRLCTVWTTRAALGI